MRRREFMQRALVCAGLQYLSPVSATAHTILIVMGGGVRKKEYLNNQLLTPNIFKLAQDAYVFEEDHCERVASHTAALAELLQGRESTSGMVYPTILDYVGNAVLLASVGQVPHTLTRFRPRLIVCREMTHDIGHQDFEKYLAAVRATDGAIGRLLDWVTGYPYFHKNTSIVIRPEFGRDDEVNEYGGLHHSYGFYCTHRVASIFWGPDFNQGVNRDSVISALDMVPTLARLLNVKASYAQGRVLPGLFKQVAGSS